MKSVTRALACEAQTPSFGAVLFWR